MAVEQQCADRSTAGGSRVGGNGRPWRLFGQIIETIGATNYFVHLGLVPYGNWVRHRCQRRAAIAGHYGGVTGGGVTGGGVTKR